MMIKLNLFKVYWFKLLLLASLIVIPTAGTPLVNVNTRLQPLLLQLAATQPQEVVRVIVQQRSEQAEVTAAVEKLGGRVTRHFAFINAFVAELPAGRIPTLAQAAGVHYISLDGAMQNAAALPGVTDLAHTASDAINWTLAARPAPARQSTGSVTFVTWATALGTMSPLSMNNAHYLVDEVGLGPDGYYGHHTGNGKAAFTGFAIEVIPDHAISKVEAIFPAFVNSAFNRDFRVKTYVGGVKTGEVNLPTTIFQNVVGAANAGFVYVDITSTNAWQWGDFQNDLQIAIETGRMLPMHAIYYDAVGLRVTSTAGADSTVHTVTATAPLPKAAIDTSRLANVFPFAVRAPQVWNAAPGYLQGEAMTVAVVDSGIAKTEDLKGRNVKDVNFNKAYHDSKDRYGHGTFVASMIAGDGKKSGGAYLGIAPKSHLLNLRVSDDLGMAYESDVVAALQWIHENKSRYNIRAVNLSLNASTPMSYHLSPLNAAVELVWFSGVVVVVAAGNNGTAQLYPPANDPFVITVGATDDRGTQTLADDVVAGFSAYGTTADGHAKPDLVAPGRHIVMYLPTNNKLTMGRLYRANQIDNNHFRMSGTSIAAPIVAGAVALLLQDEPTLTPDQVKYRLMATANKSWAGYNAQRAGTGYLDIQAAVNGTTTANANTGVTASQLLWPGTTPTWGSVSWNSVSWNTVSWNSVSWNTVSWNSVSWNSDYWDTAAAAFIDENLNAQGLPVPINVGDEATAPDQAPKSQVFLPLINH